MNAVTKINTQARAILSQPPQLDDRLNALLRSGESKIIGPKTASTLKQWLLDAQAFEEALEMPTPDRVEALVGRLSLATAKRKITGDEAEEILNLYWRALKDTPIIDLAAAFDELLRTSTFLPVPAEIHTKAAAIRAARRYAISRARHLIWRHEREYIPPPSDLITAAELAEIKRQAGISEKFCGADSIKIRGAA